jgi:hypothetical protein
MLEAVQIGGDRRDGWYDNGLVDCRQEDAEQDATEHAQDLLVRKARWGIAVGLHILDSPDRITIGVCQGPALRCR